MLFKKKTSILHQTRQKHNLEVKARQSVYYLYAVPEPSVQL